MQFSSQERNSQFLLRKKPEAARAPWNGPVAPVIMTVLSISTAIAFKTRSVLSNSPRSRGKGSSCVPSKHLTFETMER